MSAPTLRPEATSGVDPNATAVLRREDVEARFRARGAAESLPKADHPYPLPPLTAGQLFGDSFHLYRRNVGLLVGTTAILAVAEVLLTALVHFTPLPGPAGALWILAFFPASMGLLALPITARYLGQAITIGEVFSRLGGRTFGLLLAASLAFALAVLLGTVLLVVPGIFLLVRFLFATQVIVLERADLNTAFRRSWALVEGSWWRVFGLFLLVNLPAIPGVIVIG
ncbi:MAG: hypothetical protein JOZ41_05750, partial [Chloroflexi bacterium]|nr:hypothetical protein [Chloroflexota bacterium]